MTYILSRRSFDGLHAHIAPQASAKLLASQHAVKVREAVYRPGSGRFVGDRLNLWRASGVKPRQGDFSHIAELIRCLFPREEERRHILDLLAFHIQHPGQKVRHALIVRGPQGSGKNTLFGRLLASICGPANHRVIGGEALGCRFNNELVNLQVLVVDEVMHRDGWEVANKIKPLISEDQILSEAKGEARRLSLTPRLMIILSNDRTPLPIEDSDRRFFVPAYGEPPLGPEFYSRLAGALEAEAPAFLADLLARDVGHFDPNAPPPTTEAKEELKAAVKPPLERLFRQWLEDGYGPFAKDIIVPRTLVMEARAAGYALANDGAVQKALQGLGGVTLGQLPSGLSWPGRPRCWCVRNHEEWRSAGPAAWARHLQTTAMLAQLTTGGLVEMEAATRPSGSPEISSIPDAEGELSESVSALRDVGEQG